MAVRCARREPFEYGSFAELVVSLEDATAHQPGAGLDLRTAALHCIVEGLCRAELGVRVRTEYTPRTPDAARLRLYARIVSSGEADAFEAARPATPPNPHLPPPPASAARPQQQQRKGGQRGKSSWARPTKRARADEAGEVSLTCRFVAPSLFVAGRYVKELRSLAQSPWFDLELNSRVGDGSVQEVLYDALLRSGAIPKSERCKLISAGREDLDVRMRGDGRPFAIELVNPTRPVVDRDRLKEAERELATGDYGALALGLRPCSANGASLRQLQTGESEKTKRYEALCYTLAPLTDEEVARLTWTAEASGLKVAQGTPVRVLHRRSSAVREKFVLSCEADVVPGTYGHAFVLRLTTGAGTYVKEFVHGDLGRTHPSVASLLGRAAWCLQLDVLGVSMEFDASDDDEV